MLALLTVGAIAAPTKAQTTEQDPVAISAALSADGVRPGGFIAVAVVADLHPNWHISPDPEQNTGIGEFAPIPTTLRIDAPEGVELGPAIFPVPEVLDVPSLGGELPTYSDQVVIYVPIKVADDVQAGAIDLPISVRYQACDDQICHLPKSKQTSVTLQVVADAQTDVRPTNVKLFIDLDPAAFATVGADIGATQSPSNDKTEASVTSAMPRFDMFGYSFTIDASTGVGYVLLLLTAALGGLLLNATPCVLPVIPIKILGLQQSADHRGRMILLGVVMSAGVVAFWLGLGGLVAGVTDFSSTNQLFHYPAFTISVGLVIAILSIGMCGLFAVRLPAAVYRISPKHDSVAGSFGFGIMTAVLSTPCTAPFMGYAAAWSTTQTPATTLQVFAAIGVGMALPYLALVLFPGLVEKLPRSGPGSELVKQVMGLLMLAAAAYFLGIGIISLTHDGTSAAPKWYWLLVAGCVLAAAGWLGIQTWRLMRSPAARVALTSVAVVLGVVGLILGAAGVPKGDQGDGDGIAWVYYTPERFDEALASGKVVLMDFTAEWCLNCKVLEATVLETDAVRQAVAAEHVVAMKVDLTGNNPDGNAKLKAVGRVAIPLLVVFAPDGSEVFKSDFYTATQVLDALKQATPTSARPTGAANPDQTPVATVAADATEPVVLP